MIRYILLFLIALTPYARTWAQGWTAEVRIDLEHMWFAQEIIEFASITYDGTTVTGSSTTRLLRMTLEGTGPAPSQWKVFASGHAYQPYQSEEISVRVEGEVTANCTTVSWYHQGENENHFLYVYITVYPRLTITPVGTSCENLVLKSPECSPSYTWEVSDHINGPYFILAHATESQLTATPENIREAGLTNPYGRKYFRVTGMQGTTSEVHTEDLYYPPPSASFQVTPPRCHNGEDGELRVEIHSSHASIDDFVLTLYSDNTQRVIDQVSVNNQHIYTFSGLAAGAYRVQLQNNTQISLYGSCFTDIDAPAMVNPEPVVVAAVVPSDYNGFGVSCAGANDGTLLAFGAGGTGDYVDFEWSESSIRASFIEGLSAGTYGVRVSDSHGCWSALKNQTLTAPAPLNLSPSISSDYNGYAVSCHDNTDGTAHVDISGGVAPYTTQWSTGVTQNIVEGLPPGEYSVTVTDLNNCSAEKQIVLRAPDRITLTIDEVAGIRCAGQHDGILEVRQIANTIGSYQIHWSTGETTELISNQGAGNYTVTVTDEQGCTASASHTLVDPPQLTVAVASMSDYNGSAISCFGAADAELKATLIDDTGAFLTALQYAWTKNGEFLQAGVDAHTATGVSSGYYEVEATDVRGCLAQATYVLNDPEPMISTIMTLSDFNGIPIRCHGGADGHLRIHTTGGTGDYSILWSDGNTLPDRQGLRAGHYEATVTDQNGCTTHASKVLEEPALLQVRIDVRSDYNGAAISCSGRSDAWLTAVASGGIAGYDFSWSTGASAADLVDVPEGDYTIVVTDRNGCTTQSGVFVEAPSPLAVHMSDFSDYNGYGVSCYGESDGFLIAGAEGGTGPYRFVWEDGPSSAAWQQLRSGTYTVSVADINGCYGQQSVTLVSPPPLELAIDEMVAPSCHGTSDGYIQATASGGVQPLQFSVNNTSWQESGLFSALTAQHYSVNVRDVNGCRASAAVDLPAPEAIEVRVANIQPALCGDARGSALAVADGGVQPYRFEWRDSEGQLVSDHPLATSLRAGLYTIIAHDARDCKTIATTGISATDGPEISFIDIVPVSCSGTYDGGATLSITGGRQPYVYQWENGQQTLTVNNLRAGPNVVEVTDADGCTATAATTIPSPPPLEVVLSEALAPSCAESCDGSLRVSASGGNGHYAYEWDDFTGEEWPGLCAGSYAVVVTDQRGCSTTATFRLDAPLPVAVRVTRLEPPKCAEGCDGVISLSAEGGSGDYTFLWNSGAVTATADALCAGTYTVQVRDRNNCFAEEIFTLEDPPAPIVNLGPPVVICNGQTHTVDAGPQWQQLQWQGPDSFTSDERRITLSLPGEYRLTATDLFGCIARDTFTLIESSELLSANFLMTAEANRGDTVVIIDITWPVPEHIAWNFPDAFTVIDSGDDMVLGNFAEAGTYTVGMTALLAGCHDTMTKQIQVHDTLTVADNGRWGYHPMLEEFMLYPNPNEGVFEVVVSLREPMAIRLSAWSTLPMTKLTEVIRSGKKHYTIPVDLRPASRGTYFLRLDYGKQQRTLRFVIE